MSRTYAHSPVFKSSAGSRAKRWAAKAVRRLKDEIGDGRAFARHYPQYDVIERADYEYSGKSRFFRKNRKESDVNASILPVKWPYNVNDDVPAFVPVTPHR